MYIVGLIKIIIEKYAVKIKAKSSFDIYDQALKKLSVNTKQRMVSKSIEYSNQNLNS